MDSEEGGGSESLNQQETHAADRQRRTLRARLAVLSLHAAGTANTGSARDARGQQFLDQVDPDRTLPESEGIKRAEHARKAHMIRMAQKRWAR